MDNNKLDIIVCPKQKVVKIFSCKGKKGVLLKTYRFKQDIPKIKKTIIVDMYDGGAWSVSERDYKVEKEIMVYDENVINSIRERTLQIYLTTTAQPPFL